LQIIERRWTYEEITIAAEKLVNDLLNIAGADELKPTPHQLHCRLLARGSFLLWNVLTAGSKKDEHKGIWERLNKLTMVDTYPEATRRMTN
jgi:hypothetical protein